MERIDEIQSLKNTSGEDASQRLRDEVQGVIPPYILIELTNRNPGNQSYAHTLEEMQKAHKPGYQPRSPHIRGSSNSTREVYDAKGQELEPGDHGVKARFEGDRATGDTEIDRVYDYTGNVRDFYKQEFGRNSIDDNGMKFVSRVNYGQNFQNAYWDGQEMTYGRPDASSPFKTFVLQDVTAHEITHGITQFEVGLGDSGQAGALNESFSDVFGQLVSQWSHHQKARDAHWVVGEGAWKSSIHGRGLRDMLHPGTAYDDPLVGKDPQPADMAHYMYTEKDNGGVHINCGIPNRAFAEFATSLGGNAWDEAGHIWYRAMQKAGGNPNFSSFANATVNAASELGYQNDLPKLQHAWKDVGVKPASGDYMIAGLDAKTAPAADEARALSA